MQIKDFLNQSGSVEREYAQCVACLIVQSGTGQVDFNVFHVFFGGSGRDFLADGQGGGIGFVFGIDSTCGLKGRRCCNGCCGGLRGKLGNLGDDGLYPRVGGALEL